MKSLLTTSIAIGIAISSLAGPKPSKEKHESETNLSARGFVFHQGYRLSGAIVKIYDKSSLHQTISTNKKNRFEISLPKSEYCTIEITMPGYITRRIAFSTLENTNSSENKTFEFSIDMYTKDDLKGMDASILDFPVALVQFDNSSEQFEYNENYSKKLMEEYDQLLNEMIYD